MWTRLDLPGPRAATIAPGSGPGSAGTSRRGRHGRVGACCLALLLTGVPAAQAPAANGVPMPTPVGDQNLVQFVNESAATLLLGVHGPTAVRPRENTWELPPGGVLTLDIPDSWRNSTQPHDQGPRFWARTGCRYDAATDTAQCETGDCGARYDCSAAGLAGVAPATLAEFCFHCGNDFTFWDVSGVDGMNLSMDIQPLGDYPPDNPVSPGDQFWCVYPNAVSGQDLRGSCPAAFQLKRSQLGMFIDGSTDDVVACFSNCGRYEYPVAPAADCLDSDPNCAPWRQFCCQAGDYDTQCTTDADCTYGGACWEGKCACRGFTVAPDCPPDVCTNQGPTAQPPYGLCDAPRCIGDDTMHAVSPRAYTWPNDPQTYNCNTQMYRVTFSPGGSPAPITAAGPVPLCRDLPPDYGYAAANQLCSGVAGRVYGGARLAPAVWDCSVSAGTLAILCQWDQPMEGEPDIAVAGSHDLGKTPVGTRAVGSLRIGNTGMQPLSLTGFSLTGTDFAYASPPDTIVAGGTADLGLTFTPQAAGPRTAILSILSNDPDAATATVTLKGFGTTAALGERHTLPGSSGVPERFVYSTPAQANGVITGFRPGEDVLDVAALLAGLGYTGTDPFADGTLVLAQRRGSTYVSVDPDGRVGPQRALTLTRLDGVPLSAIQTSRDIDWVK